MDIGAEPDVIGKIPAVMIGIRVKHDVVAVPEPACHIVIVIRRDLKEVIVELKPFPVPSMQPENVICTNRTGEVPGSQGRSR